MKIYGILRSEGTYDEYREWVELAFTTKEKALEHLGYNPDDKTKPEYWRQYMEDQIQEIELRD